MSSDLTREEIVSFGERVKALLLDSHDAVLIAIGAEPPSPECRIPSCTAIVRGFVGKGDLREFSGNAVNLDDAISIARAKLTDAREAMARKLAKTNPAPEFEGAR